MDNGEGLNRSKEAGAVQGEQGRRRASDAGHMLIRRNTRCYRWGGNQRQERDPFGMGVGKHMRYFVGQHFWAEATSYQR